MRWEWQTKAMEGRRSAPGQATPPVDRAWPVGRPRQRGGWGGREGTPPHSFTVTVAPRVLLELTLLRSPPLPTFLTTLRFCAGFRVLGEGKGSLSRENVPVSGGPARASSSLDAHGEPAAGGAAAGDHAGGGSLGPRRCFSLKHRRPRAREAAPTRVLGTFLRARGGGGQLPGREPHTEPHGAARGPSG